MGFEKTYLYATPSRGQYVLPVMEIFVTDRYKIHRNKHNILWSTLYSYSNASVTNHHKFISLIKKNTLYCIFVGQKSNNTPTRLIQVISRAELLSWRVYGRTHFLAFPAPRSCPQPWLTVTLLCPKSMAKRVFLTWHHSEHCHLPVPHSRSLMLTGVPSGNNLEHSPHWSQLVHSFNSICQLIVGFVITYK